MYENGLDDSRYAVEGGRPEAMRWLLAAAEQGLPRAQIQLAEIYAGEPEMPENSVKACGWRLLAATSLRGAHLQKAQSAYQRAAFLSTPSQIAEVARFAQGWKRKSPTDAGNVGSAGNARGRTSVIRGRSANCHSDLIGLGLAVFITFERSSESPGKEAASLDTTIDEVTIIADGADDPALARDMIEVHGTEAATVARDNARAAALGGQALRAKSWIRVLGMIQRQQKQTALKH